MRGMRKTMCFTEMMQTLPSEQTDTRSESLDKMSPLEFVVLMNQFDREAAAAVHEALPDIARSIERIANRIRDGGSLFYLGAGTSGRLGVLDASECPPTFGVEPDLVRGIIAGGEQALRHAVEGAEDNADAAGIDLRRAGFTRADAVVAISASGYAPYCIGGLRYARSIGALTVSVACNRSALISAEAEIAIEAPTGAEILSGSTRLKAGTATKMILNMLSTGVMTRLGKVYGNLMVDLRATNAKLRDRIVRIVMNATSLDRLAAEALLSECGQEPKTAIVAHETNRTPDACRQALAEHGGVIALAIERLTG